MSLDDCVIGRRSFLAGSLALAVLAVPAESQDKKKRISFDDAKKGSTAKRLDYLAQVMSEEKLIYNKDTNPDGVLRNGWFYLPHKPHNDAFAQKLKDEAKSEGFTVAALESRAKDYHAKNGGMSVRCKDVMNKPEITWAYAVFDANAFADGEGELLSRLDYGREWVRGHTHGIAAEGKQIDFVDNLLWSAHGQMVHVQAVTRQYCRILKGERVVPDTYADKVRANYVAAHKKWNDIYESIERAPNFEESVPLKGYVRMFKSFQEELFASVRSAGYDTKFANGAWSVEKIVK